MNVLAARGCGIPGRLAPCDLDVGAGERVAVIGPNGAGKTSLLRALSSVGDATGIVKVGGERLTGLTPARRRKLVGYVPAARDAVWPITVRDAVEDGGATPGQAEAWLEALELGGLRARPLNEISTGERARVFLARAAAPAPPLLLADEPAANLDPRWRLRVANLLAAAARDGAAVLASTHDLDMALGWASRILVVAEGRVIADARPRELENAGVIAGVFGVARDAAGWTAL